MKNGWLMRLRVLYKTDACGSASKDFLKNFHKSLADSKNMRTFAAPFEKRVLAREYGKFIEKTVLLYKKQVPRKYNLSRSVNSFEEL